MTHLQGPRRPFALALFLSLLLCFTVGCRRQTPIPAATAESELVVFAAASLRDAFSAMGEDFKGTHPGVTLNFNFAGTQELRTQLEQGANADVFASADPRHMAELVRAGRALSPITFARNEPVIVVSREAKGSIRALSDLPSASRIVIGAPEVPIGRYTKQILTRAEATLGADFRARVEAKVVSQELNVRQVLSKVRLGEADAGIVYRTDALTTPEVTLVAIPEAVNVVAEYPLALVTNADHPYLAKAWVDYVGSAAGRSFLLRAGFLPPEPR